MQMRQFMRLELLVYRVIVCCPTKEQSKNCIESINLNGTVNEHLYSFLETAFEHLLLFACLPAVLLVILRAISINVVSLMRVICFFYEHHSIRDGAGQERRKVFWYETG